MSHEVEQPSTGATVADRTHAQIEAEVAELEHRLNRLRGGRTVHTEATVEELQALEQRLRELAVALSRIENDISMAELQSLLPDVRNWAELTDSLDLPDAMHAAHRLGHELAIERAESWRQTVAKYGAAPSPDQCFNALAYTSGLEFEVIGNETRGHSDIPLLAELRNELRGRFLQAVERDPPGAAQRDHWAEVLADRSDALLSALPDYSPRRAASHLDLLSADVLWHINNIERQNGPRRKRLDRKYRRLRAEWQERVLQTRLEGTFGQTAVAWFERLILVLIFAVLGLLSFEWIRDPAEDSDLMYWLTITDTSICAVFLWEFFFKLWLVPERGRWFYRHFLIDLIPSIPFGLLHLHVADPVRAGRLARFLRLPRLARYLRVARPLIRVFRVYGFLARGLDRLARQYANLLNRNIVIYPTRAERQEALRLAQSLPRRLRRLRAGLNTRWRRVLLESNRRERPLVAQARLVPLQQAYERGLVRFDVGSDEVSVPHDMPADMLIRRLGTMTAQEIQSELGDDLTRRLARIVRLLARAPFRWFPIMSSVVPRLSRHQTDAHTVAAASRRLSATLARFYNRWFWTADLYGTITPSQFVDRLGSVLVRGALRPAYRLTLFGLAFLLVELILSLFRLDILEPIEKMLYQFLGLPIVLLGGICYLIVLIGFWMQRMAREATEFYERAADAQFLALMETIRSRFFARDSRIFVSRVLQPERLIQHGPDAPPPESIEQEFAERIQAWLVGAHVKGSDAHLPFDALERTLLLYRDSLDGALLVDSDTRTTNQLLGNPAIHRFEALSRRFNRREAKQLNKLDLQRQASFGGPYVWFNLITRVIAHSAARLIIDYNRHALPLAELPLANAAERHRYDVWLAAAQTSLSSDEPLQGDEADPRVITTAFTVLHFLDDDPQRDREVGARFGPQVLQRLQNDRRLLVRRVFGTYPFHHLPREMRVLNLHVLYENWLAGGRAVLLPVLVIWRVVGQFGKLWAWLKRSLRELRHPEKRLDPADAAAADFTVAVRKIDRMRGPVVHACLGLRLRLDVEYLGIPLPGFERSTLEGADLDADRHFLDLDPNWVETLRHERRRAEADMKRLARLINSGLLQQAAEAVGLPADSFTSREHVRAAAAVYLSDCCGVRRCLSADDILNEVYAIAGGDDPLPFRPLPRLKLYWMFRAYWWRHGKKGRGLRKSAWRATVHNFWDAADVLRVWYYSRKQAHAEGVRLLGELLRHPSRITEILVTLRALHTLALIDILNYREHVYRLGGYEADGDPRDELFDWGLGKKSTAPRPAEVVEGEAGADGPPIERPAEAGALTSMDQELDVSE